MSTTIEQVMTDIEKCKRTLILQFATPNVNCPACVGDRRHTAKEKSFHPFAGHGVNGNQPCSCTEAECPCKKK